MGALALIALTIAMGLGGAVCSTTGGIKMLRIGVVFKALYNDVKRIMLPESTVFIEKYHHIKDIILEERQVRSAVLIFFVIWVCIHWAGLSGCYLVIRHCLLCLSLPRRRPMWACLAG